MNTHTAQIQVSQTGKLMMMMIASFDVLILWSVAQQVVLEVLFSEHFDFAYEDFSMG